eukprot:scaffold158_cov105-Cylindrotheca_fusiformis.AAC.21
MKKSDLLVARHTHPSRLSSCIQAHCNHGPTRRKKVTWLPMYASFGTATILLLAVISHHLPTGYAPTCETLCTFYCKAGQRTH